MMRTTDQHITVIRSGLMTLAGLSCLLYAVMALISDRPDPIWWFIPGAMGVFAGIGTTLAFMFATPQARRMAHDEMYQDTLHRAQRHAFWVVLGMYPVFGIVVAVFGLQWNTVFAAMGTLTGAAYLLLLALYEWRN